MTFEQTAIEFIDYLQGLYLEQRDMEALISYFSPDISWFGTGNQEICSNVEEACSALFQEQEEYSGHFSIISSKYSAKKLTQDSCTVYGQVHAIAQNKDMAELHLRVSAVCTYTPGGFRLNHIHLSTPNQSQEMDQFYAYGEMAETKKNLIRRIQKTDLELQFRNLELESLSDNIPGGACQCLNDQCLTIVYVSSSFSNLFGFSRKELETIYHNQLMEMVYSMDREAVRRTINQQLSCGNTIEVEFRVRRKDQQLLWIYAKSKLVTSPDGTDYFYGVLLDNTERKKEQEELRLSLERHHIIMNQTTDIIFEWDIINDSLSFSSNWIKKFGYAPIQQQISNAIPLSSNIHAEDMPHFVKIMNDSRAGIPYSETEFRIRNLMGDFIWCRIRATAQYDSAGNTVKVTGVILDIDRDKCQQLKLMEDASKDPLTGLLNKNISRHQIETILNNCECREGFLFIIDLDDFKRINDCFGHLCGDSVLTSVALVLKKHFSGEDIIARVGGDEFLVFSQSVCQADQKAIEILKALESVPIAPNCQPVSCSIGIASYPCDADSYYALFNCADHALYHVKMTRKGGYALYTPEIMNSLLSADATAVTAGIDSNTGGVNAQLTEYIFNLLYYAADTKQEIPNILELIGKTYNINDICIYRYDPEQANGSIAYEWNTEGTVSFRDTLHDCLKFNGTGYYFEHFNKNGIFYCPDTRELANQYGGIYHILDSNHITTLLQFLIQDHCKLHGFIGFHHCQTRGPFSQEQIHSLGLISRILSVFIIKRGAEIKPVSSILDGLTC